jgi:hypothetical protein
MSTLLDFTKQRLALTEFSLPVWRGDADYLAEAAAGSATTGLVDAQNVLRAGEIIEQIETERRVLQTLQEETRGPWVQRILDLMAEMDRIETRVKSTYRQMNGLAHHTALPDGTNGGQR